MSTGVSSDLHVRCMLIIIVIIRKIKLNKASRHGDTYL